jgi:DNA invertase Pin-like site-specific DNA recombinase
MERKKFVAIYARVSTDKQKVDMQISDLQEFVQRAGWIVYREFVDNGFTGKDTSRPAFKEMMDEARKRKFDMLLVWKLDRLSRSLKDLIGTLDELGHLGIDFISYDNKIDTSSPTGKLVFQIIGAVAEFERDIISERVRAGLRNARRKGKRLGRPPVAPIIIDKARLLRSKGLSYRNIGKQLGISEGMVRKGLKQSTNSGLI